jgi:glycosyltransferase involved in cell wall biosynthesis
MRLSILVPVLNEADSLQRLHAEIRESCEANSIDFEVLFIDDGSTDTSWSVIEELAEHDERVTGIRFRRNFGKAAALTAGMRAARGQLFMMMDADLQDDPAEIPKFLEQLGEGYDVVNGWKSQRLDPWHKVYPSKVFNWMVSSMSGLKLHDHNCGLKLFRSEVASEIRIYGELHRFIAVLANARGFRVGEIPVNHRKRVHGQSKYGVRRFLRGFLDLLTVTFLTSYGQRPQHMLGAVGLLFLGLGSLGLGYLGILWIATNILQVADFGAIGSRPLLAYSVAFTLLGGQALSLGLLAELLISYAGRETDTYSVFERTGGPVAEQEPASQDST